MSESSVQIIVAIIMSGGLTLLCQKIGTRYRSWQKGREKQKRSEIDAIARDLDEALADRDAALAARDKARAERDAAIKARDQEAARRRTYAEHASYCRRLLYAANCVDPNEIPPFPE